jgi:hypothetical protein
VKKISFDDAQDVAQWLYEELQKTQTHDKKGESGIVVEPNSFLEDAVFTFIQISGRRKLLLEQDSVNEEPAFWSEIDAASSALWVLETLRSKHKYWRYFSNHLLSIALADPNVNPRTSSDLNVVLDTPPRRDRYQEFLKANNTLWELLVGLRFAPYAKTMTPDDPLTNASGKGIKVPDLRFEVKPPRIGAPMIRFAAECKRLEGDLTNMGKLVAKARTQVLEPEGTNGVADIPIIIVNISNVVTSLGHGDPEELRNGFDQMLDHLLKEANVYNQVDTALTAAETDDEITTELPATEFEGEVTELLEKATPLPTVILFAQGVGLARTTESTGGPRLAIPTTVNAVRLLGDVSLGRKQVIEPFVTALKA